MTFTFGTQASEDTSTGGSGGDWIRYFAKDGEYQLRFLEEWERGADGKGGWTAYWEHFSQEKRAAYPCTGNKFECPGCLSENENEARASKRFLVNAIDHSPKSDNQGKVSLWKIPQSLREQILRYNEKAGTLLDRDYVVIRTTDGNRTTYSMDREDREPIDAEQYAEQLKDHQQALNEAYAQAWDEDKIAERAARQKKSKDTDRSSGPTERSAQVPEEPPFILKTDAEKQALIDEQMAASKPKVSLAKPEPTPEEDVALTESQIRAMDLPALKALYARAGLQPAAEADSTEKLAEDLISQLG